MLDILNMSKSELFYLYASLRCNVYLYNYVVLDIKYCGH